MLFDLEKQEIPSDQVRNFDVAIIGAGAAGISLAIRLAGLGKTVALLEAGGLEYSASSQDCYRGVVTGDPYFELHVARLRYLGGTTNHWAGYCRSFEAIDFQRQYLGDEYAWPIEFGEVDRYLKDSCAILDIPGNFQDSESQGSTVKSIEFQFSPPTRFLEKYLDELKNSQLISVFLNSNLKDFSGEQRRISSIKAESYSGKQLEIVANQTVLAMGGIENSRFLLWMEERNREKYFDQGLPIGRYWMEHPHFVLGRALVDLRKVPERFYSLVGNTQVERGILNCGFRVDPLIESGTKKLIRDLMCVAPSLGQSMLELVGKKLVCGAVFMAAWEQAPSYENAVTLGKDRDQFDIPRVNLRWSKTAQDRDTIKQSVQEFNKWLQSTEGGRIQLDEWMLSDGQYPTNDELAGYHHMGGTRMHASKQYGVVDSDCKVHGSENLYVAGSSVFTTGGHNNPTLPIVQLSLRLAEHLNDT